MSINEISAVKVVEKGFDFETYSYTRTWITELRCDSIITYL